MADKTKDPPNGFHLCLDLQSCAKSGCYTSQVLTVTVQHPWVVHPLSQQFTLYVIWRKPAPSPSRSTWTCTGSALLPKAAALPVSAGANGSYHFAAARAKTEAQVAQQYHSSPMILFMKLKPKYSLGS